IEAQTVRWIAELIGVSPESGGLLVSGGNMANIVGFLAARAAAGGSRDVRARGLAGPEAPRFVAYVSAEAHTWVEKAADLAGMGTDAVRWLETDDRLHLDPEALRAAVAADRADGLVPMIVVGSAGTVMTGAVDPLRELGSYCRDEGIWFHVDGAYGGFAAVSEHAPDDLREGLDLADSVAVDPHKWLYAPLEAGCALVRDAEALRAAFAYHPPYYAFGQEAVNFVDYGPQNSRGFRALKVWLALRQAGRDGYRRMIDDDILLARHLHGRVEATPELEAMVQGLSISTFRFVPDELRDRVEAPEVSAYLNELNEELRARIERGGEAFLSNAVIGGRYALRACIVNMNTTAADVEAVPGLVLRVGRALHAEKRDALSS
ncbi:MAG: aminotransferase class V-fold PLP-dependent enzyme, partial [Gemmatimonadota bacterium]|nr:aminotransferase class V-fold PLP-dependent enzyme [Gemmatimonadota bacterium]